MDGLCPYGPGEIRSRIRSTDLAQRFETGQIDAKTFFGELCALLSLRTDYGQFCEMWNNILVPGALLPDSLFAELKARGYRLILLSNTNSIHYEMARERYSPLRYFDDAVLSYQVGFIKPSPEIYAAAIAKAGCAPEECFFTDDVLMNIEAARAAGMDAVQFVSAGQLMEELAVRRVIDGR
jgi:putative hydrolase of the HAD superfamily